MPIRFTKYVDITSGVGGASSVAVRELIGRYITDSELEAGGTVLEFTSASAVGDYFGVDTPEHKRAVHDFGFISKNIKSVKKVSFGFWDLNEVDGTITAIVPSENLATLQAETTATLNIIISDINTDAVVEDLTIVTDWSVAITIAGVAAIIEASLQLNGTNAFFTGCTVTATADTFVLTGGGATNYNISMTTTTAQQAIKWNTDQGAIYDSGAAMTATEVMEDTTAASDNFGSFAFMTELEGVDTALTNAEIVAVATWNEAQNNKFIFQYGTSDLGRINVLKPLLENIGGVGLNYRNAASGYEFLESLPMNIMSATDYEATNSVQNFMYYEGSGLVANVTTDILSDDFDSKNINYYGQTQSAGQFISFYQRGFLQGSGTDALDMGVYANESWLKSALGASFMNAFLALSFIPANATGKGQMIGLAQSVIDQAKTNGTITSGKELTSTQKLYITSVTGDELAWYQIQDIGYWLDAAVESYVASGGATEYKVVYTLVYAKNDSIRAVEGSNILI